MNQFEAPILELYKKLDPVCQKAGFKTALMASPGGAQVVVYNDGDMNKKELYEISVICFPYSYGGSSGLLEIMWPDNEVEGYLTVEEAFEKIKRLLEKEENGRNHELC